MANKLFPLTYNSGSINAANGQTIAFMNRTSGTTPLSPTQRDDMALAFSKMPEMLAASIDLLNKVGIYRAFADREDANGKAFKTLYIIAIEMQKLLPTSDEQLQG